jgi:hypothetical protein
MIACQLRIFASHANQIFATQLLISFLLSRSHLKFYGGNAAHNWELSEEKNIL